MKTNLASGALLASLVALLSAPAGTAYAGRPGPAVSDEEVEAPIDAALTGAHSLQETGSVLFRAGFQDRRGEDPQVTAVVVDGWLHNLVLVSGEPSDGIYQLALPMSSGCREYFFHFVDGEGVARRYPARGSLLTEGEGGCPVGYLEDSIEMGESQKFAFFMLSANPGAAIAPASTHFLLRGRATVQLTVHDVSGRIIRELLCEEMPAGVHDVAWDGRDQSGAKAKAGLYFYRLRLGKADESVAIVRPEATTE